jgi:FkbM family methyltransferase
MTREYLLFLKQFLTDSAFRHKHLEMRRLSKMPRYHHTTTDLVGKPLEIVDNTSFFAIYEEIFEKEIYRFASQSQTPRIIDGGANIGLASIYFKLLFPQATVIAFEPDHDVCAVLKRNLKSFGFDDVEVREEALWSEETDLSFVAEGADSGRLDDEPTSSSTVVKAVRARDLLTDQVDFLKLDIEGAEIEVLEDCSDVLGNVENIFVEYHSFARKPQEIDKLFQILSAAGFRTKASTPSAQNRPFVDHGEYLGMDFLINVYAYRS